MAEGRFVAYYRVSIEKQGRSGLGLEAQRQAVEAYLNGGSWKLVAEFTEIESGKRSERPKLAEAVKVAKRHKATLVIAKLDRLSRNVAFIANLMEAGADFVAVDMPHANKLTIHILSAVAEHEREMISHRTRAALAAAKSRGVRLGNRSNIEVAQDAADVHEKTTPKNDPRRVKTFAGRRMIPLHPILIKAGFIQFIDWRHKGYAKQLFRELRADQHGFWSSAITKRLNRIIRGKLGITNPRYSAYSLRHNFIDACRSATIPEETRMKIVGHQLEGVHGGYGNPWVLPDESALIDSVRFDWD